jgi:hypothetical protein
MRSIVVVLLALVLAALSGIAWELNQIRRELFPLAALSAGVTKAILAPGESAKDHDERLRREVRHSMHDSDDIIDEGVRQLKKDAKRTSPRTPVADPAPRQ